MTDYAETLTVIATAVGFDVSGEIDASTVSSLAERVAAAPSGDLVLDMSGVQFIDSSGLRVLIETHQRLEEHGHRLLIAEPSVVVRRLFEISGLTEYLHIAEAA